MCEDFDAVVVDGLFALHSIGLDCWTICGAGIDLKFTQISNINIITGEKGSHALVSGCGGFFGGDS